MKNYTHRFEIEFQKNWKATILIDETICRLQIKELVDESADQISDLLDEGEEYPYAFAYLLALHLINHSTTMTYPDLRDLYYKGSMPLDGSKGVFLESCSQYKIPTCVNLNVYQKVER